jgi:nucleoside-diphosphate-sugar epimerase
MHNFSSEGKYRGLLITGAPGWLGDSFLKKLFEDSIDRQFGTIRVLVQPGTDLTKAESLNRPGIEIVEGDIRDPLIVERATNDIDIVFHAASVIHVKKTSDWYSINTKGTENLVEKSIINKVKRIVFISSNAAGGMTNDPEKILNENDIIEPKSHYGKSKLLAEQILLSKAAQIESVILRPCMFYGPPVPSRHIDIYKRILNGRMPFIGDGNYKRSLVYIDNLLQACFLAIFKTAAINKIYYIADDEIYTTRKVIEAMAKSLEVEPKYFKLHSGVAKVAHLIDSSLAAMGFYWQNIHLLGEADWNVGVSIEKAKTELGYAPTVGLEVGMRNAIGWCKKNELL